MRFHLRFRNFRPDVVAAATNLFDQKPWQIEDEADFLKVAQSFVDAASNAYGVRTATVELEYQHRRRSGVRYEPAQMEHSAMSEDDESLTEVSPPKIVLKGRSVITLLKGTRIHALAQGDLEPLDGDDPWAWACSLFYTVRPVMFRARVREGRIKGVTARDTYSSDTWQRMVEAGVTRGDRLYGVNNFDPRTLESNVSEEDLEEFVNAPDLPDAEESDVDPDLIPVTQSEDASDDEDLDEDPDSDLPRVADMNRDALRALAAQWKVPGRGTMNAPELGAKLVELGRARP